MTKPNQTKPNQTKPNQTKRQKLYLLILLIFFSFNGIGQTIIPSTNNPSHITSNTTWSDPVYYIYDDIVIDGTNGATLTIEDGVTLIFGPDIHPLANAPRGESSKTGIFVENNGAIIVNGAQNSMVTMTALDDDEGWEGISIIGNPNNQQTFNQLPSHINYCIIEKVVKKTDGNCNSGLHKHGAIFLSKFNNIIIENSMITNNIASFGGGIMIFNIDNEILLTNDFPKIINNQIYNNTARRGGAICILYGYNQSPLIQGNDIYDNTALFGGGAIAVLRSSNCSIQENAIFQNTAECQGISTVPDQTGGGAIIIGLYSNADIIGNIINNNSALFNPSAIDETGLGGGILVRHYGNAIINENQITDNQAENGGGIAVYTKQSSSTVVSNISAEENIISGNIAYSNGGGIAFNHSYGDLKHNEIFNNYGSKGGGLYVFANRSNASVTNNSIDIYLNKIFNNNSLLGGGIYACGEDLFSTEISIINNLIYSNQSHYDGAGIYFNGGWLDAYINNNTITKNSSFTNTVGNAFFNIDLHTSSTFSITNNIMFFNDNGCQILQYIINPSEYNSNDIMDLGCIPEIIDQNYDIDPEFVDFDNNQFSLSPSSSLIDLGNNSVTPIDQYDIAGNTRIIGQIDIGAYEFQNSILNISKKAEGTIYPNPASKQITINSDIITENSIIEIYSADAKLLIKQKSYQNNRAIIEVDKLLSGLYFIKVISETEVFTDKFIKN